MTVVLGAAAIGYALGRIRLGRRIGNWNWARTMWSPDTRTADFLLWIGLHPVKALGSWRRRNQESPTVDAADLFKVTDG